MISLRMLVAGHQAGTSHHTHRVDMELAKADAFGCQPVQIWRVDFSTEATKVRETDIVSDNENDVGTISRRGNGKTGHCSQ